MRLMRFGRIWVSALALLAGVCLLGSATAEKSGSYSPTIPATWDDQAMAAFELPLANPVSPRRHVTADYYYRIPVRPIYKSYPVYAPGKEPSGYMEWLKQQEPVTLWDATKLKTENDWIEAGKIVFEAPIHFDENRFITLANARDAEWYKRLGVSIASDGTVPFIRYVVRQKGRAEVGVDSCATCHARVMPDGRVITGGQGNFPYEQAVAFSLRARVAEAGDKAQALEEVRRIHRRAFRKPWQKLDENTDYDGMSLEEIASQHEAIPPGVHGRVTVSLQFPVATCNLIGVQDAPYLDHTGLMRQRNPGDLMRYTALVQGILHLDDYMGPDSREGLPPPATQERYGDDQLYALVLYLYNLAPPANPHRFDAVAARGKKVFEREGCETCHTPPLYTNNKLTPADGFAPPAEQLRLLNILPISVGTDAGLALLTQKGTGYYKGPSLKGVWHRGPFEHMGSVATLEDWFDPRRLRDDYVPTGFKGYGGKTRAVKGHEFALDLSPEDRKALIAFLKTL